MDIDRSTAGVGHAPAAGGPARAAGASNCPAAAPASGVGFQALLESLETRARELRAQSAEVTDARSLSGAVDAARISLGDALTLSESLLEAVRQARQQGRQGDGAQDAPGDPQARGAQRGANAPGVGR
jgi:hypothetical protein